MRNKGMVKAISITIAASLLLIGGGISLANDGQNLNASAKASAQIAELNVISESQTFSDDDPDWQYDLDWSLATNILSQEIKTSNGKDLFIDASLLSGLYTETNVKSKGGNKDTSAAAAAVLLRVEVDDVAAYPGWIIFNARMQVLSATLQGIIGIDDGAIVIEDFEEIGLIIGTMSANSFNFIVPDLGPGMHYVNVSALCVTFAASQAGSAHAVAAIGLGSVTIEEVRMVKGENVIIDLN
jgi:hypothetical protein